MSTRKAPPKTKSAKRAPIKGNAAKAIVKPAKGNSKKAAQADSDVAPKLRDNTKTSTIITMLKQEGGTTIEELSKKLGWERHSVHGLISGKLRKKMSLTIRVEKKDGVRFYSIAE